MINRLTDPSDGRIFYEGADVTAGGAATCARGARVAP